MHRERRVQRVGWMRRLRKPVCRVGAMWRLVLGAAAVAMTGGLHAAGLFQPVGTAEVAPATKSTSVRRSAHDAWERPVGIDRHELTAARDDVESTGTGRLLLNVRNGVQLDVVVERTAPTRWGYSLSGRVVGESVGFVTLVVHEDAVAGSIWTPESAYEFSYIGNGIHALRDVTNAPPLECGGALPSELPSAGTTAHQDRTDTVSVVDILVLWTPRGEKEVGGQAQTLSQIDLLIAYTNDAFDHSGALVSLNLVGAEQVDALKAETGTILGRLYDPADGHMDYVHDRRDALGADLIYLLVGRGDLDGGARGQAAGPFGIGVLSPAWEAAITFAHEVGHNFGVGHDRFDYWQQVPLTPYQHGSTNRSCMSTIMSNGGGTSHGCRGALSIPIYASPWRYGHAGRALGVTRFSKERGIRGAADAVLTLNRSPVANYRSSRNGE